MPISFDPFVLDRDARLLLREATPIHLSSKAFDLLALLVAARPNVVSKDDLQQALWPDTFVVEANLPNLISEIRAALGDEARAARFIRTVHGHGYAFCADATETDSSARLLDAVVWLEWGERHFPLAHGTHVIGRDADASVRIEGATVSRRHARLTVSERGTRLEDLDSKNGTFRGAERLSAPVPLAHGDTIRIGSVQLKFYVRAAEQSTETQVSATEARKH